MTNTTVTDDLPLAFSARPENGFEFNLRCTPAEFRVVIEALSPFLTEDTSIEVGFASRAYRDSTAAHGSLRVRVTDDEFRSREVAEALLAAYNRINGDAEDDEPEFRHTTCHNCMLEVEGVVGEDDWHDRGGSTLCPSGERHVPYHG